MCGCERVVSHQPVIYGPITGGHYKSDDTFDISQKQVISSVPLCQRCVDRGQVRIQKHY